MHFNQSLVICFDVKTVEFLVAYERSAHYRGILISCRRKRKITISRNWAGLSGMLGVKILIY